MQSVNTIISITEIIRQMKQGQTQPFLTLADNGKKYIIKGARATSEGLVREWIAGHLGVAFGLPIPDFTLAYVDSSLIEFDKHLQSELGDGIVFASEFCNSLQEITYSGLINFDQNLLKDVFVFDFWIKNDDRNLTAKGGNPNLFFQQQLGELIVLDHNLAFDNKFNLTEFKQLHVGVGAWGDNYEFFIKDEYHDKIDSAFQKLENIVEQIPQEWLDSISASSDFIEQIRILLNSYQSNEFWGAMQ